MTFLESYRGQPLVALVGVLGGWVVLRTVVWNIGYLAPAPEVREPGPPAWSQDVPPPRIGGGARALRPVQSRPGSAATRQQDLASRAQPLMPVMVRPVAPLREQAFSDRTPTIVGHNLMWMAALSQMPLPSGLFRAAAVAPAAQPFYPIGREPERGKENRRWSADGWLLLRSGGSSLAACGAVPATYGASQTGAVLRYRLANSSPHRPAIYLRASAALGRVRDREAALGLSARPVPALPVSVAAELRASDRAGGVALRPAVSAITELPAAALPYGVRIEAYGQAGYVGGRGTTAFVDGQIRADRRIGPVGPAELRAGGGVWGGAQKGASRLDFGPTATVSVPLGRSGGARLGVDWRFRVVGNAAPSSGPALTVSAGF